MDVAIDDFTMRTHSTIPTRKCDESKNDENSIFDTLFAFMVTDGNEETYKSGNFSSNCWKKLSSFEMRLQLLEVI